MDNQDYLYVGTDNSFFARNLTTPSNWIERIKGMHIPRVIAVEPRLPTFFSFSDKANYSSANNGVDWSTRSTVARISENLSAKVSPIINDEMLKWTKVYLPDLEYEIYHSSDSGHNWNSTYLERHTDLPFVPNFAYGHYPDDPSHKVYTFTNQIYQVDYYRYLLRSSNLGDSWDRYDTPYYEPGYYITSVACDPNYDQENHIYISGSSKTYESQNGGLSWMDRCMPAETYEWAIILFKPENGSEPCSRLLQVWASNPSNAPRFSQTTDFGVTWSGEISLIEGHQLGPTAIDPEDPSLVYTAPFNPNTNCSDCYLSVDYCHVWVQDNRGLPATRIWNLAIDPNAPEYLYAGTDSGVYCYDPPLINKHLVSSSSEATSTNSAKKMIRGGVDDVWITYESGGVVYAVHSTDAGTTWSRKMEIGLGCNPAISFDPNPETPIPGIVWWAPGDRDSILFARFISGDNWTTPIVIEVSDMGIDLAPPSFVIGTDAKGRVVYEENSQIEYTEFNIYNPNPITPEEVGRGENPSIGFMMPGATNPEIHVVWEDNGKIKYRSRPILGTWGAEETVFPNNSTHPSIEVAGTNVYVVWERFGDIHYRYAVYQNGNHSWSRYLVPCPTPDGSSYPVLTGGNVISWTEYVDQALHNIYFCYNDAGSGWVGPMDISASTQPSTYSHVTHKQTFGRTTVYFVWTEGNADLLGLYDIAYDTYSFGGSNPDVDLALYIAEGGDTIASPFNVQRDGYVQYGPEFYKKIDYDTEYLEYHFGALDPEREYALAAYVYHEGNGLLPLTVKIDNAQIGGVALPPETLIVLQGMLPQNLYADSAINLKIVGPTAVSAHLVLYEYEKEEGFCGGGGGPQNMGSGSSGSDRLLLSVFPNPVQEEITIRYSLPKKMGVNLSVFDITGRLVMTLVHSDQGPGVYCRTFRNKDISQGVYFIKLDAGNASLVEKAIFHK